MISCFPILDIVLINFSNNFTTKTFDAVKGPDTDKTVMIAHLWSLYSKK